MTEEPAAPELAGPGPTTVPGSALRAALDDVAEIGPFFADFTCQERKLVIEIDGSQHVDRASDRSRDAFMQQEGYSVLRFWNTDVFSNMGPVCETILAALSDRLSKDVVASDMRYIKAK